ncbi:MAG: hypothetical protein WC614_13475 [bacterium]
MVFVKTILIVITILLCLVLGVFIANRKIIKTSDPEWFKKAISYYKDKENFLMKDDAKLGVKESDLTSGLSLIKKAKQVGISWKKICAVLTGLGLCLIGLVLIGAAILDQEPTSRLAILLAGGVVLIATGGLTILRVLGLTWKVNAGKNGFLIEPVRE